MGTFVFTWSKPGASSVYVTGTFDDWKKTEQLNNENGVFTKKVTLPSATDVVHYKFVVDGDWVIDETAATDKDALGNTNNVLREADITPSSAGTGSRSAAPIAAGAAAGAAAVGAAGAAVAHHSKSGSADMPGAFPQETPNAGKSSPGMLFYPGDIVPDYSTYFSATSPTATASRQEPLAETSKEKEQTFSVNPLPPTSGGFGNPAPGETNTNTLTSAVAHNKASYDKPDALPSSSADSNALNASKGAFGVPPVTSNLIPESSLPIGTDSARDPGLPFIASSAGTGTSTAALAGQVPLEPRGVPEVVKDSQEAAHVDPEASASPEALQSKDKLEQELQKKVPEKPATSEDTPANKIGAAAAGAGGIMAATAAAFGFTSGSQSTATQKEIANQSQGGVPAVVSDSQHKADAAPEASANPEAVTEKSAVEKELTKKVPEEPATSQDTLGSKAAAGAAAAGAAVVGGAAAAGAYATSKLPTSVQDSISNTNSTSDTAKGVPAAVSESQHQAHVGPEASANPEAVTEKSAVEKELTSKVPLHNESGQPAPTATASTSATAPATGAATTSGLPSTTGPAIGEPVIADESTLAAIAVANREPDASVAGKAAEPSPSAAAHSGQASTVAGGAVTGGASAAAGATSTNTKTAAAPAPAAARPISSRDVSPMTRGNGTSAATGADSSSSTPARPATGSASKEEKKKNRRSFFGRIKDKIKEKS